jgi:hypothetical protein
MRHPSVGVRIALRMARELRSILSAKEKAAATTDPGIRSRPPDGNHPKWSDTSSGIGKVLFTAVIPGERRTGVGLGLKKSICRHAASIGLKRLDARIAKSNAASLRMNLRAGWELYPDGPWVIASVRLDDASGGA